MRREGEVEGVDARGVVRVGGVEVVAAIGEEAEGAAPVVATVVGPVRDRHVGDRAERLGDAADGLRAVGRDPPDALETLNDKGGAAEGHAAAGPGASILREDIAAGGRVLRNAGEGEAEESRGDKGMNEGFCEGVFHVSC